MPSLPKPRAASPRRARASLRRAQEAKPIASDAKRFAAVAPARGRVVLFEHDLWHSGAPVTAALEKLAASTADATSAIARLRRASPGSRPWPPRRHARRQRRSHRGGRGELLA